METRFDQMTKILAAGIPRREALRRLAGLFGGGLFGGALLTSRARADYACHASAPTSLSASR